MINYKVLSYLNRMNKFAEMQSEMDIFGYQTKQFYICPGVKKVFEDLMESDNLDEDTIGMIISAAQLADKVFDIEKQAIANNTAQEKDFYEATQLALNFKDLIREIDNIVGMNNDVSFMGKHLLKIKSYL